MTDKKISELDAKTTVADTDMFVLVDVEADPDETKLITGANLKVAMGRIVWKDASEQALSDSNRTVTLDWTDLDLTAYTSANAKFALLQLVVVIDSIVETGDYIDLAVRKNGTTPDYYPRCALYYDVGARAGAALHQHCTIALDSGQVIEYRIGIAGTTQADSYIRVLGYME